MSVRVSKRFFKSLDGLDVPAYFVEPEEKKSADKCVLYVHGYSSSKDEVLGIAVSIAEEGHCCVAIDLRGHGENKNEFDENVLNDVEGVVKELKKEFKQVISVGHSIGGLLSLLSSADYAIAISPPLMKKVADVAKFMLRLNSCKVVEKDEEVLFRVLERLNPPEKRKALLLYGDGESEAVKKFINDWAKDCCEVVVIKSYQARLPRVEVDAAKLMNYLPNFISHLATPCSREVLDVIKNVLSKL